MTINGYLLLISDICIVLMKLFFGNFGETDGWFGNLSRMIEGVVGSYFHKNYHIWQ